MSMCCSRVIKMVLYGIIIVVQIIQIHSFSASQIFGQNDNGRLKNAAENIASQCFGSSERWSELLIIAPDHASHKTLEEIHHQSKTSNTILFLDLERNNDGLSLPGKCKNHFNTSIEWRETKATAVIIATRSVKHLEYVLSCLKNDIQRLWRPGSYFLIVLDNRCDVAECNNMFKLIWDYWILNAVILTSSNSPGNRSLSEIELYTFNPYSADHPQRWETIIQETLEVSISPENFNHSWYIFKQKFTDVGSLDDCRDIFFDKTSNLDGYVIPISVGDSCYISTKGKTAIERRLTSDILMLKSIAKLLRFDIVEILNNDTDKWGERGFINGSYVGVKKDIFNGRSYFLPIAMRAIPYHGIELIYPHDTADACLASRIVGNRPQWTNLAVAKQIWIGLGLGLLFSTVVFYLHNKSQGIVPALLNAERLIFGSSVIHTSAIVKNRTIIGSMILVVLVIDGAIKGRFISILTVVTPYPNIETLEQVEEQHMHVWGPETYKDLIRDPKQKARYHNNTALEPCLNILELGERQQVCLTDCRYLMYHATNSSIIHKATTPVWTAPVGFLTTPHWPMKNRYSFEVRKLVESGIYQKWKLDPAREAEVEGWKQSRALEPPFVKPTKLNDLLPAFVLLIAGLSVALIVFACEVKHWKYLRCAKIWK